MNDYTEIGKITKPLGLKGKVRVLPISNDLEHIANLEYVYIGENKDKRRVLRSNIHDKFVVFELEGIYSIPLAESLREELVYIDTSQLRVLDEDDFFVTDLIGCKVVDENDIQIGVITDIDNYGSGDIITLKTQNDKEIQFPFLKRVVKIVDIDKSLLQVNSKEFDEVRVDED